MMAARGVLRTVEHDGVSFFCPGCKGPHIVYVGPQRRDRRPRWSFNGDYDRPTFSPSVHISGVEKTQGLPGARPTICHSFVTDGQIQFLNDSMHDLAGQTVQLRPVEEGA